jgi:hypothetical protein
VGKHCERRKGRELEFVDSFQRGEYRVGSRVPIGCTERITPCDVYFNQAFAASGLSTPYSQLDETTLYSLVTYHTLPVSLSASLPASGSANSSTSNGDGSVIVGDVSGDKVEVVSPIAGSIKLDDLDEGEQTGALTGLGLFEVDTVGDTDMSNHQRRSADDRMNRS